MLYLNLFNLTATTERTATADVPVSGPEDLKDVSTKALVDFYNKAIPSSPIKKFATREKAVERVYPLLVSMANAPADDSNDPGWEMPDSIPSPGPTARNKPVETQQEEDPVATATSTKSKSRKAATSKAKTTNGKRGRAPFLAGAKLSRVGEENPCRAGGIRAKSWDMVKGGMTYETYIKNGGDPNALAFNIREGRIKVEKATKAE